MKESDYILVSNLAKLNMAKLIADDVFFVNDNHEQKMTSVRKLLSEITQEIYETLDGEIEVDEEGP